jgi:hypothetical protein
MPIAAQVIRFIVVTHEPIDSEINGYYISYQR